ncbi:Transmembrane emp24 domain-containing protein 1 [Liparis tanakae]|uniref:Transmembrane emp24 domain-containing protein 1 n=1 Tax=Liparis tanakae TaxID=230148 RepID=A0A4Z2HXH8_9TELE|nr:Transmembrane emp24 domain-containing protein 1 [Liparis tanakae]
MPHNATLSSRNSRVCTAPVCRPSGRGLGGTAGRMLSSQSMSSEARRREATVAKWQGALAQSDVTVVSERVEREEPGRITEASSREQMLLLELQHGLSMAHHDYRHDIEKVNEVIAGSGLDVGFVLISPSGHHLVSDFRRSDAIHKVDPTEEGDYRLCFDNSFSKLSEKIVFFGVIVNRQSSGLDGGQHEWGGVAVPESLVGYKLEDIRVRLDSMHQHLERSRHVLTVLRTLEARDRYLLEDNLWRVSFWSGLSMLVMLSVAVTQVYTLRRLFDGTRRVCT